MRTVTIIPLMLLALLFSAEVEIARAEKAVSAKTLFYEAGTAYQSGDYAKAIQQYEAVLNRGLESGPLYYNLGNSYFKAGKLGQAILNYERAALLIPRDSDLKSNDRYARSQIQNYSQPAPRGFGQRILANYRDYFTVNELTWIVFVLAVVMAALHAAGLYARWPAARVRLICAVLAAVVIFNGLILTGKLTHIRKSAVLVSSADAKFEPTKDATTYFALSEGETILVLKLEGDWAKIERQDGRVGWVEKARLERLL